MLTANTNIARALRQALGPEGMYMYSNLIIIPTPLLAMYLSWNRREGHDRADEHGALLQSRSAG